MTLLSFKETLLTVHLWQPDTPRQQCEGSQCLVAFVLQCYHLPKVGKNEKIFTVMDARLKRRPGLAKCIEQVCGVTIDSVGFSQESTVCYECCVKLNKIKKFEKDIETLKTDIARNFLPTDPRVSASGASGFQSQASLRSQKRAGPSVRSTSQSAVPVNDDDNGPAIKRWRVIVSFPSLSL